MYNIALLQDALKELWEFLDGFDSIITVLIWTTSIRPCHFCMTFDLEDETYICYAYTYDIPKQNLA